MTRGHLAALLHDLDDEDCAGERQCKSDHQGTVEIQVDHSGEAIGGKQYPHEQQLHYRHMHNGGAPDLGLQ